MNNDEKAADLTAQTDRYFSRQEKQAPAPARPKPKRGRPLRSHFRKPKLPKNGALVGREFGSFWRQAELVYGPSWKRRADYGQSPTGIPDNVRAAPKEKDLLDRAGGRPGPIEESTREVWKFFLTVAGILLSAFVAGVLFPTFWSMLTPQVREFILTIPLDLAEGNLYVAFLVFSLFVLSGTLARFDPWGKKK